CSRRVNGPRKSPPPGKAPESADFTALAPDEGSGTRSSWGVPKWERPWPDRRQVRNPHSIESDEMLADNLAADLRRCIPVEPRRMLDIQIPAVHDAKRSGSDGKNCDGRAVDAANARGFPVLHSRSRSRNGSDVEWKRSFLVVGRESRSCPSPPQRRHPGS